MFSAFALAEHSVVPVVRNSSVSGLKLGVSVMLGVSISGTGYRAYVAIALSTTRTVRRGFESDRRQESLRRMERFGAEAASAARREDASGGNWPVCVPFCCCFRACLRRCGGSSSREELVVVSAAVAEAEVDVRRKGASRRRLSRQVDRSKTRFERKKLPLYGVATASRAPLKLPVAEEKHRRDGGWTDRRRDWSSEGGARDNRGTRISEDSSHGVTKESMRDSTP